MSQPAKTLLKLEQVSKSYGGVEVLKPTDLSLLDGEFMTVLGPSGSGKTTILKLIGGLMKPTNGRIYLEDQDITATPINQRPFNTVFQDYALFPHMRVAENVGYGLKVKGLPKPEIKKRVAESLEMVSLGGVGERYPSQLSGGQRQRIALARAIIGRPRVVLLDEPLGALDAELRRQMQGFLKDIQRELQITFLFVTHDQEEAVTMADRICIMDHGRIMQVGTPEDVYFRPETEYVANFFGANNMLNVDVGKVQDDRVKLMLQSGATIWGQQSPSVSNGAARLCVRPEAIVINPDDRQENKLSGKVTRVEFVGPMTHLSVTLQDEAASWLVKRPSRFGPAEFSPGDQIMLGWTSVDSHLVAVN